jgi:hypothetical protein
LYTLLYASRQYNKTMAISSPQAPICAQASSDHPALVAKTDIEDRKRLFRFLHALHMAVYELWQNGEDPVIRAAMRFAAGPDAVGLHGGRAGAPLAQDVMLSMMPEINA